MPDQWPTSAEVHLAVGERLARLLDEHGGPVAEVGRRTLSGAHGLFSDRPHSLTTVLVPGACIAAGGTWRAAIWPAAAAELMMAAADLFDDVADADPGAPASDILTHNVFSYYDRLKVIPNGLFDQAIPDAKNAQAWLRYLMEESDTTPVRGAWRWILSLSVSPRGDRGERCMAANLEMKV